MRETESFISGYWKSITVLECRNGKRVLVQFSGRADKKLPLTAPADSPKNNDAEIVAPGGRLDSEFHALPRYNPVRPLALGFDKSRLIVSTWRRTREPP
jgi:hypothetical protein